MLPIQLFTSVESMRGHTTYQTCWLWGKGSCALASGIHRIKMLGDSLSWRFCWPGPWSTLTGMHRGRRGAAHRAQRVAHSCGMDVIAITGSGSSPSGTSIVSTRRPCCRGSCPPRARPTRFPLLRVITALIKTWGTAPLTADAPGLMRDVYSGIILYLVVCSERG
jgi:hypothetical protein